MASGSWLSATSVAAGDITGDGRDDIVVLAHPISGAPPPTYPKATLYVFRQEQQGGFASPVLLSHAAYADVKLGDVDGDGDMDIVASSSAGFLVYQYRPDGTFQVTYSEGNAGSLGLLDVNLDGRLDAVTRTIYHGATVWFGDGTGAFPKFESPHVIWSGHDFAVGDVTSDGLPDIVAPDNGQYLTEVAPHAQITGGTPTRYAYELSDYGQPPVVIGDFDHDGRNDIALAIQNETTPIIHFRHQDATRTLGPASSLALPARAEALAVADMDGNGWDDLVLLHGSDPMKLGVLLQADTGFAELLSVSGMGFSPQGPGALALGDLNSDRCRDAVAVTGDRVVLFTASGCMKKPTAVNCRLEEPLNTAAVSGAQAVAPASSTPLPRLLGDRRTRRDANLR